MSDLHNESIFITGGGSGLGLALVERFIEEGAQVATLELSAAKVASLRQRFGEHPYNFATRVSGTINFPAKVFLI